jgi:hypothetical protein
MAQDNADTTPEQSDDVQEGQNQQATSQSDDGESTVQNQDGETVTIQKGELDELKSDRDDARNMQSIADKEKRKVERKLKKMEHAFQNSEGSQESDTGGNLDTYGEYTPEEKQQISSEAERGVMREVINNSDYRDVLDNDSTLNDILARNPLALIDEYIDAEDAVEQITGKLDERVESMKQANAQQNTGTESGGEQSASKEVSTKGAGGGGDGRTITPEEATSMSQEEYAKLPANVRQKLMIGETATLK